MRSLFIIARPAVNNEMIEKMDIRAKNKKNMVQRWFLFTNKPPILAVV